MMNQNYEMINGTNINVTTVMDTTVKYTPTAGECNDMIVESRNLINQYFDDMLYEEEGLHEMFSQNGIFWDNKGWLIDAFKRHPGYNGNYQIVLKDVDMCRHIDEDAISSFVEYFKDYIEQKGFYISYNGKKMTHIEALKERGILRINSIKLSELKARITTDIWDERPMNGYEDLLDSVNYSLYAIELAKCFCRTKVYEKSDTTAMKMIGFIDNFVEVNGANSQFADDDLARNINRIAKENGYHEIAAKGQKLSRIVGKIADICGIKKHVNIQDVSFYRADGEYIERTKDIGWNYQYAKFCDAINPITLKATAVISVNPIDYLTMSFGNNWASCHTIDKENRRRIPSNHYHGCYCGGTESYMLDKHSIVFYYLPKDFNGNHPELEDKVKRCMFYLGEDKLIQSRVYPDGRDGGEKSLAGDIRALMQKITSEIFDVPNYWSVSKGTRACEEVTSSEGVQYPDYTYYDDCNVSYMKRIDGYKNLRIVPIGRMPICPECGEEHDYEENIFCRNCSDGVECAECGCRISRSNAYWVDDDWYCEDCTTICDCCGERVHNNSVTEVGNWTYVCQNCLEDDYIYCEYDDEYVRDYDVIETEEGNYYAPNSDGYSVCVTCGEIHDIDELRYDEETDEYYCEDCYEELLAERENEDEE